MNMQFTEGKQKQNTGENYKIYLKEAGFKKVVSPLRRHPQIFEPIGSMC